MAGLAETDPAYAAALSDLEVMELDRGEVAEAQRIFDRVIALRSDQLDATPPPDSQPHRSKDSNADRSCIAASKPSSKPCSEPRVPAPKPTPSASSATSRDSDSISTTTTTTTSDNTKGAHDPPISRPRGGAGIGMAGGAAIFARALGNRPSSSRPRRGSGAEPGSYTPPPTVATAAPAPTEASPDLPGPESNAPAVAGAFPSCTACAAVEVLSREGGRGGRSQSAAAGAAIATPAGFVAAVQHTAAAVTPAAAVEAEASGRELERHRTSGERGGDRHPATTEWETATAEEACEEIVATGTGPEADSWEAPPAESPVVAAPAPTAEASGEGQGGKGYLATAAAAVAAMTARPSGWSSGGESTAGGYYYEAGRTANNGGASSAGGCGGGGRSSHAAAAVREYFLSPRADSKAKDREGDDTDAALRATLGDCRHVLELYGLSTEIRTSHLQEFVSELASQDGQPLPVIKWVDDNHALLVCPDGATAEYLLQVDQEFFRMRSFADASPASLAVAAADLLPPRERPKTTAAVAKRLLSHALGMRELRDREAEKDLAVQRKAAREARQERERKLAAAWDDE